MKETTMNKNNYLVYKIEFFNNEFKKITLLKRKTAIYFGITNNLQERMRTHKKDLIMTYFEQNPQNTYIWEPTILKSKISKKTAEKIETELINNFKEGGVKILNSSKNYNYFDSTENNELQNLNNKLLDRLKSANNTLMWIKKNHKAVYDSIPPKYNKTFDYWLNLDYYRKYNKKYNKKKNENNNNSK